MRYTVQICESLVDFDVVPSIFVVFRLAALPCVTRYARFWWRNVSGPNGLQKEFTRSDVVRSFSGAVYIIRTSSSLPYNASFCPYAFITATPAAVIRYTCSSCNKPIKGLTITLTPSVTRPVTSYTRVLPVPVRNICLHPNRQ